MNILDCDLNLLVVFDAVLAEGGISRAADRLGLSQPAASNALARLCKATGETNCDSTADSCVAGEMANAELTGRL